VVKRSFYIICFALSAVLLTVIQPPFGIGFLAWVALVPFVIGCLISEKAWPAVLAAYIISLLYWLGNLYWLILVTIPGGIAFCFYIAVYWPILVMCLRYCRLREIPLWFSLPILIVGAEAFQGLCFKGFGWRYLGHSQYENIAIIQIADIFGAAGISFLIAMVNGLIADIISHQDTKTRRVSNINLIGIFITSLAVIAAIIYGRYRINQTADFLEDGPRVGVVQSNVSVKAGQESEPIEETFLNMLAHSKICLMGEPSLIIWPETMIEAVLDDSYLKLVSEDDTSKVFHNALVRHSGEGVYLLVGAFAGDAEVIDGRVKLKTSYNSAFLYEPDQTGIRQHYNKIHLVPFGEYIPFKDIWPFLGRYLMKLTPYDYDYTLNAGSEYTVFKMSVADKTYRFGVMICYEDTVPKIARKMALGKNKNKQIDWLVNISNDGWFVRQEKEKIKPTVELVQHMAICIFRAVENRVGVIRSVNTGISCYIDSLGRIHNGYITGTISKEAADRAGQRGWFVDQVVIDKRVTFFSQSGQSLEIGCAICLIFTIFMSIYRRSKVPSSECKKQEMETEW
jgi:apolipoprotein N-acyltransferase